MKWPLSLFIYASLTCAVLAQSLVLPGPGLTVASGGGGGTPTFTACPTSPTSCSHQNGATTATTVPLTLGAAVPSGNACMVVVSYSGSAATVTVTDDKTNTYTQVDQLFFSALGFTTTSFYILNVTNGPTTITGTIPSNAFGALQIDCYSNIATTAALDVHAIANQTNPGTGANAITSGSVTTTAAGELVYGFTLDGSSLGVSVGTGFTGHQAIASTYFSEGLVQGSAGATAATFTTTHATDLFTTLVMTFKHL